MQKWHVYSDKGKLIANVGKEIMYELLASKYIEQIKSPFKDFTSCFEVKKSVCLYSKVYITGQICEIEIPIYEGYYFCLE